VDSIHSINPRKVSEEYRERLDDLAAEVTQFLDQATFGKLAKHMDPAPTPRSRQAQANATQQQEEHVVHVIRPVLTGVVHFNCQNCGAPHRIDLGELGAHGELGEWSDDQPDE